MMVLRILLILFLSYSVCFSAVSITSVVDNGNGTLTITGSGFGTHADYSTTDSYLCKMWENFEGGGNLDSELWSTSLPGPEFTTSSQRNGSTRSIRGGGAYRNYTNVFGTEITNDLPRSLYVPNPEDSQVLFMSGWFSFNTPANYALSHNSRDQCKTLSTVSDEFAGNQYWGVRGQAGDPLPDIVLTYEDGRGGSRVVFFNEPGDEDTSPYTEDSFHENEWHRYDIEIDVTRPLGEKISIFYVDGINVTPTTHMYYTEPPVCGDAQEDCPRHFTTGAWFLRYFRGYESDPYTPWEIYVDDCYVSNTLARVEISNTSTWTSEAPSFPLYQVAWEHKELQPPISWSDTEIVVHKNKGSFQDGDIIYFYVVDGNGSPNTTGYQFQLPQATIISTSGMVKASTGASLIKASSGTTILKAQ